MIFIIGGSHQGKTEFANSFAGNKLLNLHEIVYELLKSARKIDIDFEIYDVITCNELGCGIIPIDKFDANYRETVGRLSCEIAKNATEVYRVFCGIPTKIKG